jgi:protein-L-isoaspartate(D-aspartate) O-methyltransferase
MDEESQFEVERRRMVKEQISGRDIRDSRLLEAMQVVPRHLFVPREHRHLAYADGPLPIGGGQTISQPYIVALMTQLLNLKGSEKILEVGTGSGYQAAILAHMGAEVHTIERDPYLAERAAQVLSNLNLKNVYIHVGDGSKGLKSHAPYQAILVTAAAPSVPPALLDQLDECGRMVIPVGGRYGQYLEKWQRSGEEYSQDVLVPVAFVPLRGEHGWKNDWDG